MRSWSLCMSVPVTLFEGSILGVDPTPPHPTHCANDTCSSTVWPGKATSSGPVGSLTSRVQGMSFSVILAGRVLLEDACTENPTPDWHTPPAWRLCHGLLTVPDTHLQCNLDGQF